MVRCVDRVCFDGKYTTPSNLGCHGYIPCLLSGPIEPKNKGLKKCGHIDHVYLYPRSWPATGTDQPVGRSTPLFTTCS
jgi:hypothetical protein